MGPTNQTENVSVAGGPTVIEAFPFDGHTDTHIHKYGVDLKQNIFRWENWVALQRADAQVAQAEADYQAAQQDLISRVAQRYFDVLASQDDVDAQESALESVTRQLDQAEQRYQVGLIAITDVQEARAAHDSSAAARHRRQAPAGLEPRGAARDHRRPVRTLARPIEPFELADPDPVSEDRWVEMALQQNLSLVSSRLAADIARDNVSSARGGHYPSLDLVASGYKLNTDGDQHQHRRLALRQRRPSIRISARSASSSPFRCIRAAWCPRRCARRSISTARPRRGWSAWRARPSTTRATPISGVISEINRVKALRRAVESNTTALNATQAGYEAGTRTAVDVLESRRPLDPGARPTTRAAGTIT